VATRGPPLKSSYLLAKIATLISLKSNLLTIERPAAAARDAEFPWATEFMGIQELMNSMSSITWPSYMQF